LLPLCLVPVNHISQEARLRVARQDVEASIESIDCILTVIVGVSIAGIQIGIDSVQLAVQDLNGVFCPEFDRAGRLTLNRCHVVVINWIAAIVGDIQPVKQDLNEVGTVQHHPNSAVLNHEVFDVTIVSVGRIISGS